MIDIVLLAAHGSAAYPATLESVETQVGTLLHIALENKLRFTVTSLCTSKVRSLTHQYWPCKEEMLDIGVMAQCRSAGYITTLETVETQVGTLLNIALVNKLWFTVASL